MGEHDRRRRRVRAHGRRRDALAVLRAAAEPEPALRLRARRRRSSASSCTLWNSVRVLRPLRATIEGFRPTYEDLERADATLQSRSTAGSSRAREQLVARGDARRYEDTLTRQRRSRAFEAFVDDLSNWYIRRSRRRFWTATRPRCGRSGSRSSQALRVIAPVMPFLAEHLWQRTSCARRSRGRAGVGLPRRLARAGCARRGAARRDRSRAAGRRARPPGARRRPG